MPPGDDHWRGPTQQASQWSSPGCTLRCNWQCPPALCQPQCWAKHCIPSDQSRCWATASCMSCLMISLTACWTTASLAWPGGCQGRQAPLQLSGLGCASWQFQFYCSPGMQYQAASAHMQYQAASALHCPPSPLLLRHPSMLATWPTTESHGSPASQARGIQQYRRYQHHLARLPSPRHLPASHCPAALPDSSYTRQ
jgi:hypothetical protein